MTTYSLHLIDPFQAIALVQRVDRTLAAGDMSDWAKLHKSLEAVHATPHLASGAVWSSDRPLTHCSYHSRKPDLVANHLPDQRSINWIITRLIEMTAYERCMGGWSKFGSDYDIHVQEHVLPRRRALTEIHLRFVNLVLAPPSSEIPELEFLRNPDAYCSVTTTQTIAKFVDEQDAAGYFETCVKTFMSLPDDIWGIFAADIRRLELFLRSASLLQNRAVWFTCWAT